MENYQVVAPGIESSKKAQGCKRKVRALVVHEIEKFMGAKCVCWRVN